MKIHTIPLLFLFSGMIYAENPEVDWSKYGTPIAVTEESKPETALDREIKSFITKHKARNAALINNSAGRALNKDGRIIGSEALGRLTTPVPIIIITEAMVADSMGEFFGSIKKLPDCAHIVRIIYTESEDRMESSLLGYTIANQKGDYTKLVKYDGKTSWLKWITKSFKKDDAEQKTLKKQKAEQGGPDRPLAAP